MKTRLLLSALLLHLAAASALAGDAKGPAPAQPGKASGAAVPNYLRPPEEDAKVYSVAELYRKPEALDKKKVAVHGRAVKVTSGIMGKTWSHIEDGSGDKSKGTDDIICISTSNDIAVGDVVTITGRLVHKPDNPRYKVTIDEAVIAR